MHPRLLKAAALSSAFALAACNATLGRGPSSPSASGGMDGQGGADWVSAEQLRRALSPPNDRTETQIHDSTVRDPFRPLEDTTSPETRAWVERENRKFDEYMKPAQEARDHAMDFMKKSRPAATETVPIGSGGSKTFAYERAPGADRWSVAVRDADGASSRVLLDPAKIDPSGDTGIKAAAASPDGRYLSYVVNKWGSDQGTLRVLDVAAGKDTGLAYPNTYHGAVGVTWDTDSKGFLYNSPTSPGSKNYNLRHHQMGTEASKDTVAYSLPGDIIRTFRDNGAQGGTYEWLSSPGTTAEGPALLARPYGSKGGFDTIVPAGTAQLKPIFEAGGQIYAVTDYKAPKNKVISFDPSDPAPEKWRTVVPESADMLEDAQVLRGRLVVNYLHDTANAMKVYNLDGGNGRDVPLPAFSSYTASADEAGKDSFLVTVDNYRVENNVYRYDFATGAVSLARASAHPVNLEDAVVERIYATSKDGTKVPMTVIRQPGTELDGTAATMLYGYGGFDSAVKPAFSDEIAMWVKEGGIYVRANLRGGGEFGPPWYNDGRLENKQNTFYDLVACGEHLVRMNYTTPERLAIDGASNGGLTTVAVALQSTGLFGAVVTEYPVTDMLRFPLGSHYGYSWESDYGDPGVKKDFNTAAKYSPLHNVPEGWKHAPLLVITDVHDDRVAPWHSYKLTATIQTREDPSSVTVMKTYRGGGHGAGGSLKKAYENAADVHAFAEQALGPLDQEKFRAQQEAKRGAGNDNVAAPAPPLKFVF